jgi:hypothetical protein
VTQFVLRLSNTGHTLGKNAIISCKVFVKVLCKTFALSNESVSGSVG